MAIRTVVMRRDTLLMLAVAYFQHAHGQAPEWMWGGNAIGTPSSFERFTDITTDAVGNIYVIGNTNADSVRFGDILLSHTGDYLAMLNYAGTVIWMRPLTEPIGSLWVGPDGSARFSRVVASSVLLPDQEVSITGGWAFLSGTISSSGAFQEIVLHDSLFGVSTQPSDLMFHPDVTNGLYMAGSFTDSLTLGDTALYGGSLDRFICRFSAVGEFDWVNAVATDVTFTSMDLGPDGSCFVSGLMGWQSPQLGDSAFFGGSDGSFVLKVTSDGTLGWFVAEEEYGGYEDVLVDAHGRIFCGYRCNIAFGEYSIGVARISEEGTLAWLASTWQPSWAYSNRAGPLLEHPGNGVLVHGYSAGETEFGPILFDAGGCPYVFVALLDTSGIWQWVIDPVAGCNTEGEKLVRDQGGNMYCIGTAQGMIEFGSSTVFNVQEEGFVAKLTTATTWTQEWHPNDLALGPVPTSKSLRITTPREMNGILTIMDAHGRVVLTRTLLDRETSLDVSAWPCGLYLARVGSCWARFIKE